MNRIKVFGERNTNTNYFSKLIELNLEAEEICGVVPDWVRGFQARLPGNELLRDGYFFLTYRTNLGWKHSRIPEPHLLKKNPLINEGVALVTFTKNPYSWLWSLYKRPYHGYAVGCFEEFVEREWALTFRDNCEKRKLNPVQIWNVKNRSYLHVREFGGLNLNSESLFVSGGDVVDMVARHFGFSKKNGSFINYTKSTKDPSKDTEFYKDYYINERWVDEIPLAAFSIINQYLDKDLMGSFGYKLIE